MTFRTFEDEQGNFNSKIDIPKIDSENGTEIAANQEIEEYAESLIAQYEKDLESSGGEGHYSMESSYDIVSQNDRYVSIRINTTLVMASGTQYVKVFTIDKTTGNTVSLTDLTGGSGEMLTKISENIKEQMRAQMKEDENIAYFIDSDIPELYRIGKDQAVRKYIAPMQPTLEEEIVYTKAYVRHMYAFYDFGLWTVLKKENSGPGCVIGRAGLFPSECLDGQIEMGYMIAPECQGKGYGKEAWGAKPWKKYYVLEIVEIMEVGNNG